jgi:hypothetical protein
LSAYVNLTDAKVNTTQKKTTDTSKTVGPKVDIEEIKYMSIHVSLQIPQHEITDSAQIQQTEAEVIHVLQNDSDKSKLHW